MSGKWLIKYVENDLDGWEMAEICGKWLIYVTIGLTLWEMT